MADPAPRDGEVVGTRAASGLSREPRQNASMQTDAQEEQRARYLAAMEAVAEASDRMIDALRDAQQARGIVREHMARGGRLSDLEHIVDPRAPAGLGVGRARGARTDPARGAAPAVPAAPGRGPDHDHHRAGVGDLPPTGVAPDPRIDRGDLGVGRFATRRAAARAPSAGSARARAPSWKKPRSVMSRWAGIGWYERATTWPSRTSNPPMTSSGGTRPPGVAVRWSMT